MEHLRDFSKGLLESSLDARIINTDICTDISSTIEQQIASWRAFASLGSSPTRLQMHSWARVMPPDDPIEAKVVACGSCKVTWASSAKLACRCKRGENSPCGRDPGTRARVVYSLGGTIHVVSDSVLNEARVGFLSHPKTMRRCPLAIVSLLLVRLARSASPSSSFFPWLVLPRYPAAFTGFLHQISYTHDLGTAVVSAAGLFVVPCRGNRREKKRRTDLPRG